jgi:P pilus assembly chaperone PapD
MYTLRLILTSTALLGTLGPVSAPRAQDFAAVVSPPRFEIRAEPGQRVRQVVEITNAGPRPSRYHLRTADWTLGADGGVTFSEDLTPDSCRSWAAIERREIEVPGGGRYRYRFEVQAPPDATRGECRFALMIEGDPQAVQTGNGLPVPVSGRIGVIVYVTVGEAAADLQIADASVTDTTGGTVPALTVHNAGNAHARLNGFLSGTDARGRRLEFFPSTLPILPGETRLIPLTASIGPDAVTDLAFPVRVAGIVEWGDGRRIEIDQLFTR